MLFAIGTDGRADGWTGGHVDIKLEVHSKWVGGRRKAKRTRGGEGTGHISRQVAIGGSTEMEHSCE